jgi:hypothetical protein
MASLTISRSMPTTASVLGGDVTEQTGLLDLARAAARHTLGKRKSAAPDWLTNLAHA